MTAMYILLLCIAFYMSLRFVGECKLALAGVQRPVRQAPRGRLFLFQSGPLTVKMEFQVV
jgi:hypothetical protein